MLSLSLFFGQVSVASAAVNWLDICKITDLYRIYSIIILVLKFHDNCCRHKAVRKETVDFMFFLSSIISVK